MIAWRLYLAGGALLVLIGAGLYIARLQDKAAQLTETRQQLQELQQEFADWRAASAARQQEQDRATRGYLNELQELRVAADRPVPAVRLCPQPAAVRVPATEAAAGSSQDPAAAAGLVPSAAADPAGVDIGPGLARLIGRCDETSAQLRAVLDYLE